MRLAALAAAAITALAVPAFAGSSLTLYLDGAQVITEVRPVKGSADLTLPPGYRPGSLRVTPPADGAIRSVALSPVLGETRSRRDTERLRERRETLRDRLKALEVREEIFLAAAKSQGSKAPRRTKTNPEPLSTIRQGTDFALGKLEEVYALRRKAEQELKSVEARLGETGKSAGTSQRVRIKVTGREPLSVSYVREDLRWVPVYDVRLLPDNRVDFIIYGDLPSMEKGMKVAVAPSNLVDAAPAIPMAGDVPVRRFAVTAEKVAFQPGPLSKLSLSLRLPERIAAGEGACFRNGEYLGPVRIPAAGADEPIAIPCGRE